MSYARSPYCDFSMTVGMRFMSLCDPNLRIHPNDPNYSGHSDEIRIFRIAYILSERGAQGKAALEQGQERHEKQGQDVYHLDQGVNGRAGSVLVGVAHRVAGHPALCASEPLPPKLPASMY